MEFVEEGRHRRQAAVNRHAGEASLILVFHEGHTVTAINRLWWFVDGRKEDLQIVGVVDPGMDGLTYLYLAEEVINGRRVAEDLGNASMLTYDGEVDYPGSALDSVDIVSPPLRKSVQSDMLHIHHYDMFLVKLNATLSELYALPGEGSIFSI